MDRRLKAIGKRIREARELQNISQMEMAAKIKISSSHMSNIENGKTSAGIDVFSRLVRELNVSADWILQNDSATVNETYAQEMSDILSSCTPAESKAITDVAKRMIAAFEEVKAIEQ